MAGLDPPQAARKTMDFAALERGLRQPIQGAEISYNRPKVQRVLLLLTILVRPSCLGRRAGAGRSSSFARRVEPPLEDILEGNRDCLDRVDVLTCDPLREDATLVRTLLEWALRLDGLPPIHRRMGTGTTPPSARRSRTSPVRTSWMVNRKVSTTWMSPHTTPP